jgi:hypothetical protein
MEYLIYKLSWWLLAAFALGLLIGWISCSRRGSEGP